MKTSLITYLYIILVSLLFILVFPVILEPLDNDVFYHLLIAREMIESERLYFFHDPWFNAPEGLLHWYPPLFHWILVVFSLGGFFDLEHVAVSIQIIFYPLALLSFYKLVSYAVDKKTALVAVIVLSTFFPLSGRTHLATSEALQHVLIPLVFLYYLKGREKLCGLTLALILMNHIYDSLLISFAILAHWFLYKRESFNIKYTLAIASIGMVFQAYGIYGANVMYEYFFFLLTHIHHPAVIIALHSLLSTSILLVFGVWCFRRKLIKEDAYIFVIWFFSLLPILVGQGNRFPAYAGTPLAILAAILIMDLRTTGKKFYNQYLPIVLTLLFMNLFISTVAFPHIGDFYRAGVDAKEKMALYWMKENISPEEIIQVDRGCLFFKGYKIAYYTGHRTVEPGNASRFIYSGYSTNKIIEQRNISRYFYSISSSEPSGNWTLLKRYDRYKIYLRDE